MTAQRCRLRAVPALLLAVAVLAAGPAAAQFQPSEAFAPEAATGRADKPLVHARRWMVSAANPLAAEAGAAMLRAGGSAVDAAIAIQLVLGLVEPQSSGLGGGAFMLHWDAAARALSTLDGRETAPRAATPTLFQDGQGQPMPFVDAMVGGRSVGTPGLPRLLEAAHRAHGRLPWASLFEPALRLARDGFAVSPRLAALVAGDARLLKRDPAARGYFFDADGKPLAAGTILRNPAYADTLQALARDGAEAFYSGPIARDVVAAVREGPSPGLLALDDLAAYQVKKRAPVCAAYRLWSVCGMGPPSSGALTLGEALGVLAHYDLAALGPDSAEAWRLIGDATRLAFADRERYMADIDFVPMPLKGLLDPGYLDRRAALIAGPSALESVAAGEPPWSHARLFYGDGDAPELPATSHLSIVDAAGDIVSMTTSVEAAFGSRLMTRGFMLNNQLTDFSFRSHRDGVPIANRVEPGKRPRSAMSPTIVFRDGAPNLVLGSPGGPQIIGFVLKTLVAHLDWGLDVRAAAAFPNIMNRTGVFELEAGTAAERMAPGLAALGFRTRTTAMTSGIQPIAIGPDGLDGSADPRREGVAIGE